MGISAAVIGGSIISGAMSSNASKSAANTQANAATAASNAQLQATQETNAQNLGIYNQNVAREQPWVTQGQQASSTLGNLMGTSGNTGAAGYGSLSQSFTPSSLSIDPSYQWRLQQGLQNLQSSAAAKGQLMTGQGLKDINNYAQGAASTEYQNAFDRYQTTQNNLYNKLSGLSGQGQSAASGVGQAGTQVGQNISANTQAGTALSNNYLTSGATAQSAGMLGSANAWNSALTGAQNNMTSYLTSQRGAYGTPSIWSQAPAPVTTATPVPVNTGY